MHLKHEKYMVEKKDAEAVEETTEQLAPAEEETQEESAETEEETSDSGASQGEENEEVDYKAELEKAKGIIASKDKQLEKAGFTIQKLKKDKKETIQETEEESEDLEEEIEEEETYDPKDPYGVKKIAKEQARQAAQEAFAEEFIVNTLESLTKNSDERALIKFHYENSIKQTGFDKTSILNDLKKAKALANAPKLEKTIKEIEVSKASHATVGDGLSGGNQDSLIGRVPTGEVKLTQAEKDFLARRGLTAKDVGRDRFNNKK